MGKKSGEEIMGNMCTCIGELHKYDGLVDNLVDLTEQYNTVFKEQSSVNVNTFIRDNPSLIGDLSGLGQLVRISESVYHVTMYEGKVYTTLCKIIHPARLL